MNKTTLCLAALVGWQLSVLSLVYASEKLNGMDPLTKDVAGAKSKIHGDINAMEDGLKALDRSIAELETGRDPGVDVSKALNSDDFKQARTLLDQWEQQKPGEKVRIQALRDLADRAEKEPDAVRRATMISEGVLYQLENQLAANKDMLAQLEKKSHEVDVKAQEAEEKVAAMTQTIYPFTVETIDGKKQSLADYKGKVLLIVNTASKCGFTPQYKGLQALYDQYKDKGLVVLGFPANNFMGQEPGTNAEIRKFCELNYHVTFPMFAKVSVKGDDIAPLYSYLTTQSGFDGDITWNFNKFLINKSGEVAARFDSKTTPDDPAFVAKLNELLK